MTRDLSWTNFNYLTWKRNKNGHNAEVMIGQETTFRSSEYLLGQSTDFPSITWATTTSVWALPPAR